MSRLEGVPHVATQTPRSTMACGQFELSLPGVSKRVDGVEKVKVERGDRAVEGDCSTASVSLATCDNANKNRRFDVSKSQSQNSGSHCALNAWRLAAIPRNRTFDVSNRVGLETRIIKLRCRNVRRDPNLGGPARDDFPFGRELAPINAKPKNYVFDGLIDAADWLTRALDVQGYRLDDVKGLSTDFLFPFLNRKSMQGKFAFGEYFDGNTTLVNGWVFNPHGMRGPGQRL
jgi:hypothetical protein